MKSKLPFLKRICIYSILVILLQMILVCNPISIYAKDYSSYATINGEGTSAKPGDQLSLRIKVEAKNDISNIKATILRLAPEIVLIQKSAEVSMIQKGEMRVITIPIGSSAQSPEGKYKVDFQVDFYDSTNKLWSTQGSAFVTIGASGSGSSGGCFIATTAYGTESAAEINTLRDYRDQILLRNWLGDKFVKFYYKTSPPIANFIDKHETLRTIVRVGFVDPLVKLLNQTKGTWSP